MVWQSRRQIRVSDTRTEGTAAASCNAADSASSWSGPDAPGRHRRPRQGAGRSAVKGGVP